MADPMQPPVREGEIVAEKYRVEAVLGRGGMGVVYSARHLQLGDHVALKFLGGGLAESEEWTQRFMTEARATFRLRSEHAVRMLDLGALPSGQVFIVMELLDGQDLRQLLAARGPLPEADAARYVIDACSALEEAHALGIVHRDLKPSNLFLAKRAHGAPIVKVLDFGVSKVREPRGTAGPVSRADVPIGTPKYMAPEQWKAGAVDARTDVYALGVALYELLTGNVPLHELDLEARRARLLGGAIPSPRTIRPALGEAICKVVLRCLQAVPEGRYPSARHLAAALNEAVPSAAPRPPRVALGTTAVTKVVSEEARARDVALAFADVTEKQAAAPLFDAMETTKTEFLQVRGAAKATPVAEPVATQRGPHGGLATKSGERPAVTPPRERMPTPTRVDPPKTERIAAAPSPPAAPAAPPAAPAAPVQPMRPRMLTPTQNDPRSPTLASPVAPAWLPGLIANAPPPPPGSAPPPLVETAPPAPPVVPSVAAPIADDAGPRASRFVLAIAIAFFVAACVGGAVTLFLVRAR